MWVLVGLFFIFLSFIFSYIYLIITAKKPDLAFHKNENKFVRYDVDGSLNAFPTLFDEAKIYLSLIVPAYNEQNRLLKMMEECVTYLENMKKKNKLLYEIIIVDDGSSDKTTQVASHYVKEYTSEVIRILTLHKNRGKGQAIRLGTLCCRGKLVLFADADGATKFSDFQMLEAKLKLNIGTQTLDDAPILVCGSRAHMQEEALAKRSVFRNILMLGFQWAVWIVGGVQAVKDTQCGFKLMTRQTARILFTNLHVERWAFDVELLYLASKLKIKIYEVPVHWHEIPGSKIVPIFSWLQMGRDILIIRLRYELGIWKINSDPSNKIIMNEPKVE